MCDSPVYSVDSVFQKKKKKECEWGKIFPLIRGKGDSWG